MEAVTAVLPRHWCITMMKGRLQQFYKIKVHSSLHQLILYVYQRSLSAMFRYNCTFFRENKLPIFKFNDHWEQPSSGNWVLKTGISFSLKTVQLYRNMEERLH